jgi:hypothetical protein
MTFWPRPPGLPRALGVPAQPYELIGARMLILAGGGRGLPLDYDELVHWTRIEWSEVAQCNAGNGEGPLAFVW